MSDFIDRQQLERILVNTCEVIQVAAGQQPGLVIIAIPIPSPVGPQTPILVGANAPSRELISQLLEETKRRHDERTEQMKEMN